MNIYIISLYYPRTINTNYLVRLIFVKKHSYYFVKRRPIFLFQELRLVLIIFKAGNLSLFKNWDYV